MFFESIKKPKGLSYAYQFHPLAPAESEVIWYSQLLNLSICWGKYRKDVLRVMCFKNLHRSSGHRLAFLASQPFQEIVGLPESYCLR